MLYSKHTTHVCCTNCQSVIDTEEGKKVADNKDSKMTPWSFLRVGQSFTYEKEHYTITGVTEVSVQYEMNTLEPESGRWKYQEWFCINEKGDDEIVITNDRDGFYIARVLDVSPENQLRSARESSLAFRNHRKRPIYERGSGTVLHFEGEATFPVHRGMKFDYLTYRYNQFTYGVEYTDIEDAETHAYYAQSSISEGKLLKAISSSNELTEWKNDEAELNFLRGFIGLATVASVLLLFASWIWSGRVVYEEKAPFSETDDDGFPIEKTFDVKETNSVYNLELGVKLHNDNTETYVAAEVINDNGNVINLLSGDFYRASGVEAGEAWSENEMKVDSYISFDEKGKYRFVFFRENIPSPKKLSSSDYAYIKIRKGDLLSRYFFFLTLVMIGLVWLTNDFSTSHWVRVNYLKFLDSFKK